MKQISGIGLVLVGNRKFVRKYLLFQKDKHSWALTSLLHKGEDLVEELLAPGLGVDFVQLETD